MEIPFDTDGVTRAEKTAGLGVGPVRQYFPAVFGAFGACPQGVPVDIITKVAHAAGAATDPDDRTAYAGKPPRLMERYPGPIFRAARTTRAARRYYVCGGKSLVDEQALFLDELDEWIECFCEGIGRLDCAEAVAEMANAARIIEGTSEYMGYPKVAELARAARESLTRQALPAALCREIGHVLRLLREDIAGGNDTIDPTPILELLKAKAGR
jgi:hypothetical protein